MDIDSFIVQVKSEDVYEDLAGDVETKFDTSKYEVKRLHRQKQNVIELMKDKLSGEIIAEVVTLGSKQRLTAKDEQLR